MPVTEDDVRRYLDPDEPRYERAAAQLGPEALPHLEALIRADRPEVAAKAAYLAGLIGDADATPVIATAASHADPSVRAAAAAAAARMDVQHGAYVLERLLQDDDAEVRRIAVESVHREPTTQLRQALERLAADDPHPHLRMLAARALGSGPRATS
jgi:HEAT repeat protein